MGRIIPRALIPVFYVADVDVATGYYVDILQFTEAFRYGTYVGLRFGPCELHLTVPGESRHLPGAGSAYVICNQVDEYFESVKKKGGRVKNNPDDKAYGMRDFAVFDLDGNELSFGCDS